MLVPPNPHTLLGHNPGTEALCCPDTSDPDSGAWDTATQDACKDGTNTSGYHWVPRQRSAEKADVSREPCSAHPIRNITAMAVESAEPGVAVMTLSFLLIGCCSSDKMLQSTIIGTL